MSSAREGDGLRILMLSDGNNPHTHKWAWELSKRGHRVTLFSLSAVDHSLYAAAGLNRIESLGLGARTIRSREGSWKKVAYLRAWRMVRRLIREERPDILHAHYATSYGLIGTLSCYRPRVVSVWGADVYSAVDRSALQRVLVQWVLRSADVVLSTSKVMRKRTLDLVQRPIAVTPFGVDTSLFNLARDVTEGSAPIVIGTIKTLEPKYGIEWLLRAFALLKRRHTVDLDLRLLIVGGGAQRGKLEGLAEELGIAEVTTFAGQVKPSEVSSWHKKLDIAVYPSVEDSESFGVAAVESQACGIPVVVANVGGLPEVVIDGVTGIVVPPKDCASLADAISRLVADAELRKQMGLNARKHVIENYDLHRCVDLMESCYYELVGKREAVCGA